MNSKFGLANIVDGPFSYTRHPGRIFCRFRHQGRLSSVIYPGVEIYNNFFNSVLLIMALKKMLKLLAKIDFSGKS